MAAVLTVSSNGYGYVRETYSGQALSRSSSVGFVVGPDVRPGLRNASGKTIITPESDPIAALNAAMSTWNTVPGGNVSLSLTNVDATRLPAPDGVNIITFDDNPVNRSIVGSAIAVTRYYLTQGTIIDSDITFNPDLTFSTTPTLNAFDIQAIATHELGHAIGAGHTPLLSAVMYPFTLPEDTSSRFLSNDEIAFVHDAHVADSSFGSLHGSIATASGKMITSALVLVINPNTGLCAAPYAVGGSYFTGGLPPGDYLVMAFPVSPAITGAGTTDPKSLDWQPTFFGGAAPQTISVSAASTAQADISVPDGPAQSQIDFAFLGGSAGPITKQVASGEAISVILFGKGFADDIKPEDIVTYGGNGSVEPGSINVISATDSASSQLYFTLDVAETADWADAVMVVHTGSAYVVYSSIRIAPPQPTFTPSSVVNAATYSPGPVAPGEIVSIFGAELGPEKGLSAALASNGTLPTQLEDTTIQIDEFAAPLFYASSGQVNVQVPYEIAGRPSTTIRIQRHGVATDAILPLVGSSPAIFGSYTQPAIVNYEDGFLNNSAHPATRGRAIIVYGTGQGLVDPPLDSGVAAAVNPLSRAANVTATIAYKQARVDFSGMTPGFVGLWQVNLTIPDDAPEGLAQLVLSVGDTASPPANIYVQ